MIKVGDRLPEGTFRVKQDDDSVKEVSTAELFKGQRVVFIGATGAFTSTCHLAHIPQFVTHAGELKAKGVNRIVVMAVNDHHVMRTWSESPSCELSIGCPSGPERGSWSCEASAIPRRTG